MLGVAIAAFITLAFAHAASAAFPGPNGRIAFESGGRIFTMRPNGERQRRITGRDSWEPAFSANGRWVVFVARGRGGNTDLYKVRSDGSHKVRLTHSPADEMTPSFSPGGRMIVFARRNDLDLGRFDLWKMRAGGGHKRRLTRTPGSSRDSYSPQYSPNGRRIVFVKDADLVIMRADGSRAHRITRTRHVSESHPDFAPDGSRIVFSRHSARRVDQEVFSVRANGSHLRRLTRSKAHDTFPTFSPRGGRIAFSSDRQRPDGSFLLYTMRADGSGLRRITGGHIAEQNPSWGIAR